jgi:fatty-acyl-CoA synthase
MEFVPDFASRRAELAPAAVAFRDHGTGLVHSYAAINEDATLIATALTARGVARGVRIGALCGNRAEVFLLLFACQKCGAILVPLNWRQPVAELEPIAVQAKLRIVFHDTAFADSASLVAAAVGAETIDLDGTGQHSLAQMKDLDPASDFRAVPRRASDVWYLLFTSGTTGAPKAVIQTFGMAVINAVNIGQALNLATRERSVSFLPLFHTAGINLVTLPLFLGGGLSHVLPKFDEDAVLDLIDDGGLTILFGVPAIYQAFVLNQRFTSVDFSRLKSLACGGAPLPPDLVRLFARRGIRIQNGFGMTETGPTAFLLDADDVEAKIGSVGKPQLLVEARLVDADGAVVEADGTGELQMRGPGLTPGYFENAAATEALFTADGWLRSGDIARRDEEGFYFIVDRIKDMYISGGENVYPAEVERALITHPAILEAAVVGIPDARWGEVGHAFLLPRPGADIIVDGLTPWLHTQLAAYKVPKGFTIVSDFPRTAAGKVQKHRLKERLP